MESPLTELGIIKTLDEKDGFRFVRGPKQSLGGGVFIYALLEFWDYYSTNKTLPFEAIAYENGSPGRIFALDEDDLLTAWRHLKLALRVNYVGLSLQD